MTRSLWWLPALLAAAMWIGCVEDGGGAPDGDGAPADDDAGDDDDAAGVPDQDDDDLPDPAALSEPTGDCPLIDGSGLYELQSSGETRRTTIVVPEGGTEGAPLLFFFHGLMSPEQTPEPTEYMATGLQLQALADATGAVIAVPESRVTNLMGEVYLWEVMERDELDLVYYDDLRSCLVGDLGLDVRRVTATGFSGGALFVTVLARERGDTLAAILEMSGGADVEVALVGMVAEYDTPAYPMPALLISGGEDDEWPQGGFALIDFEAATDLLEDDLVEDDAFVVRCRHDQGHVILSSEVEVAAQWMFAHEYGVASPFEQAGIDDFGEWCMIVE